ncbi:hypothetical protein [Pseudonocardia sp. H11422]|uniref:hypothetical protein n=1 Tax=Pseudonocardia sp. H11422 TaxID=2835866 RepID=UPI001BDCF67F|nr:hypothetical protein [Pseudonocardia sp. H11422]
MPDPGGHDTTSAPVETADDDRRARRRRRIWVTVVVIFYAYLLIRGVWALMTWTGHGANPYVVLALAVVVFSITAAAVQAGWRRRKRRRAVSEPAG